MCPHIQELGRFELALFCLGIRETGAVLDFNRDIAKQVKEIVGRGQICLTLGGDHSGTPSHTVREKTLAISKSILRVVKVKGSFMFNT
jgi:arginase family enzyme